MESPSGRAWEVRRNRCRRTIASQMSSMTPPRPGRWGSLFIVAGLSGARGVGHWRRGGTLRLEVLQNLLDPVLLLDRLVEEEIELGDALEAKPLADLPAQERGRAAERLARFLPRRLVADGGVVDPRLL